MTNVSLYARVSSDEQARGQSIETQLEAGHNHAAAQGWTVVAEYVDPGFSATTDQRPAFQQMVNDALKGKFQIIIVYSFDRFTRNMEDAVVYKSMLRREGIQVVSVIERMDDSPLSFIFEGIIDLFAAYYSINLSTKIRAGLRKVVANGGWPYKPPTGYKKVNGDVIVAEAGFSILTAFQEFSSGQYTLEQWAAQAYTMGIRSPDGNRLGLADWGRIFRNEFYTGIVEYSDVSRQGIHEPLVSTELFERVQEILNSHSPNTKVKTYRSYLLRGVLWSLDADSWMTGAVGKGYLYYRSRKKTKDGKCHYVPAEALETDVGRALQSVTIHPDDVNQLNLDDTLSLALRVSPNIGILYEYSKREQRKELLSLVVKKYGFKVSGPQIVDIDARAPFCVQFDQLLMEMARVELASRKAGYKRLRV